MASGFGYAGAWQVWRRIVPLGPGPSWIFTGRAEIGAHAFVEEGRMMAAGPSVAASRRYRLERDVAGVTVRLADGSAFIRLGLAPMQAVTHLCGPDLYQGRFLFADPHRWIEVWWVRGPRKAYRSLTRYTRIVWP